jgi:hypothetical protein
MQKSSHYATWITEDAPIGNSHKPVYPILCAASPSVDAHPANRDINAPVIRDHPKLAASESAKMASKPVTQKAINMAHVKARSYQPHKRSATAKMIIATAKMI